MGEGGRDDEMEELSGCSDDRGPRPDTSELVASIYDELRVLAASFMRRERSNHTLQPTAVVHEIYMRLAEDRQVEWTGVDHFRAIAAVAIRHYLVDHARRSMAAKRGGAWSRVTLCPEMMELAVTPEYLLILDQALERLRDLDPRQARVVELRYFGGLSIDETAEALGVSSRTIDGDWSMARSWLRRELAREAGS
jgi:RNA polymerase sigma-70 factor, ECF subfamily